MRERFLDFIKKHALVASGERVLLAVSGGLDSMAMLHLFSQTDFSITIAHCNFGLRGAESDGDEQFVKDQAEALRVPCLLTKFDTQAYANQHKQSIQMAARELRYGWFNRLCKEKGFDKVALAHHLNDSLETVLYHLARGTSISGLRGILPVRDNIIRPMLEFTRAELEEWMQDHQLKWREDSSNQDTKYQRNYVRHKVIEPMLGINPDLFNTFRDTAMRNLEVEQVFAKAMHELRNSAIHQEDDHFLIAKEKLTGPFVLQQLISRFSFGFGMAKEIWSAKDGLSGSTFVSSSHTLVVDRDHFIVTANYDLETVEFTIQAEDTNVQIAGADYAIFQVALEAMNPIWKDEKHALLDFDKLQFPLTVRPWKQGDHFFPLGMKGKKKLSDFMIDRKIPVNLKSRLRVVESAGNIVWVAGLRIDDRYKVTDHTRRIFCLIDRSAHV